MKEGRCELVLSNVNEIVKRLQSLDRQMKCYEVEIGARQALKSHPKHVGLHLLLANSLLKQGKMAEGFQEYEWRQYTDVENYEWFRKKELWKGDSFSNKRLLVFSEQGLGDALQFSRYLPQVKARGGSIIFLARKPLVPLLQGCLGIDSVLEEKVDLADFDLSVPLMSLPAIFGTTLNTIPRKIPYLTAEKRKVDKWRTWLSNQGMKKIGIVWSGNVYGGNMVNRAAHLADFAPLAHIKDAAFYSLQKGEAMQQLYTSIPKGMKIINLEPELKDFSETAAAIANLDLVISVDTSVPHLAGAMGKPVWTLLPFCSEWRWLIDRKDTPWYSSMRLFRQENPGDWRKVIENVAMELQGGF